MKPNLDCIPCFTRHALRAAQTVGMEESCTALLMNDVLKMLQNLNWSDPPPVMARDIHRLIKKHTRNPDPFEPYKRQSTTDALSLLPRIRRYVKESATPLETAVRFSIAGNAIDLGAQTVHEIDVSDIYRTAQDTPVDKNAICGMERDLQKARNILFLADNAGEIVFDIPLLERIGKQKLTVAVRGEPVINDATMADAEQSGIVGKFNIISNGADTPGTWLPDCSSDFQRAFDNADLIIAKGQGNYETLNDVAQNIFFLFKAKCPVICADAGVPLNTFAVLKSGDSNSQSG
jgi:damage-control phosphatase, subfamily I